MEVGKQPIHNNKQTIKLVIVKPWCLVCRFGDGLRAWLGPLSSALWGRLRAGGVCAPPAACVRWWLDGDGAASITK